MREKTGIAILTLLSALGSAAAQTPAPEWTRFEIARERLGHKVLIDATLANPTGSELSGLRVVVIFYSGQTEIRRSLAAQVDRIAPGRSAPVRIEAEQVPNFDHYEVVVEAERRRFVYVPGPSGRPPVLKKASAPRLAVVSCRDTPPPSFPGSARLEVAIRNLSEAEAREPVALVSFLDSAGSIVYRTHVRLAPEIRGLSEDTFEITVPRVPEYASSSVVPAWATSEIPPPAEPPPDAAEVAVRGLRIRRLSDGTAHVSGTVRNGTSAPVDRVRIDLRLGKKNHSHALPGRLEPGAARPFEVFVPDCPPFEEGAYSISHKEASGPPASPDPDPGPSVRRTGSRDASSEAAFVPEKDARDLKPQDPAPPRRDPPLTVQIRGAYVIEGIYLRGVKTGDVIYLRLCFRDAEGNPVRPTGSLTALLYDGDRPLKSISRSITRDSWKQDASKINAQTANHEGTAFDARSGELWVGLLRCEPPHPSLRLDLKLTLPGMGVWTWKGLGDKLEAPARGPDEKGKK